MKCPECSGGSRVITSRPVISLEGGRCRWRHCDRCRHRWYSWQGAEVALPQSAVSWSASDVVVDRQALRRAQQAQP